MRAMSPEELIMKRARARRARALRLHQRGETLVQIGRIIGGKAPISKQRVSQMIQRARQEQGSST